MSDGPLDDPGWHLSPRTLLLLVPGYLRFANRRRDQLTSDGLEALREIWMAFTGTSILLGAVTLLVVAGSDGTSTGPWIGAIFVVGFGCLTSVRLVGNRELDCASARTLASTFRTRFFIRTALSEAISLLGFVAAFVAGHGWLYWLALPMTLLGYAWNAPTASRLRDEQQRLSLSGCPRSLVAALRDPSSSDSES